VGAGRYHPTRVSPRSRMHLRQYASARRLLGGRGEGGREQLLGLLHRTSLSST
jgi:hypothetical protein